MENEDQLLMKRFAELARRAFARGRYEYSAFLDAAQQETLGRTHFDAACAPCTLWGGYDAAERRMAVFGGEELFGYPPAPPAVWLCAAPAAEKFADELTHRDFLGALMALGVKRELLGDIVVTENRGWFLCGETVADFITENLTQVRRTTVRCVPSEAPAHLAVPPAATELVVASERADAAVAAVYQLSRSESQTLFTQGKVFINSRAEEDPAARLAPGDIVSVRGSGRFSYEGILRETRKNRLRITVRIY